MNLIVISSEYNFLHISNDTEHIDYSFYDCTGTLLDGGQLDSIDKKKELEDLSEELIDVFNLVNFTKPYIKLKGIQAENFIDIFEEMEQENMQDEFMKNIKYFVNEKNKVIDIEKEREI
ncbi:MAG: hypothetical protein J6A89_04305 [Clostridia bacterium]|nr:hypothetical protein [Clostridia bacterium]